MSSFKQIQLVGFKSFADKTVIPFSEGVTGIVGPNGCGKSNIADAIRWVLGEQSAKTLRGDSMMDVIFKGTEARRAMSFCEVTLSFDNTQRIFDMDSDEVEMTRRLYKNGDSEYLLNKQPSRMKSLIHLLHGAGAGKEGYSIIGQGRIEQIMNSKPEDRRAIFEEATGILVFKDRKNDTERKLNYSKENLFTFMQTMNEVTRQLNPLKKAAEVAKKYNELSGELRMNEMNLYIYRHDNAEGEKEGLNIKAFNVANKINEINLKGDKLLEDYQQYRDEMQKADEKLRDLHQRITRFEVGAANKSGEVKVYREKAEAVKARLAVAQDEIAFSTKRIADIDKDIRRREVYSDNTTNRINALNQKEIALKGEVDEISAKISEYEFITGEHRKKVLDTFKDLSDMRENMSSLSAQKGLLNERLLEIRTQMEGILSRRDELKNEYNQSIDRGNELEKLLSNESELVERAEKAIIEVEEKTQSFINYTYDLRSKIASFEHGYENCCAVRDKLSGYVYSVQNLLLKSRSDLVLQEKIEGVIANVVSCEAEYAVAIETAFGSAMQNIIVRTRSDANYLIDYLAQTNGGQITFLPIEAMRPLYESKDVIAAQKEVGSIDFAINLVKYDKKYENIIHHFLGNTLVVDNKANAATIVARYPRAFKVVTLDGTVFAVSGSMTGGSIKRATGELLKNEQQIKEYEEKIQSTKLQLQRVESKKTELADKKIEVTNQRQQLIKNLQEARVELATLTEKQSTLLRSVTVAESEYSAYRQSEQALIDRLAELDNEYTGVSMGASDLSEQSSKASSQIDDMSEEYEKLKEAFGESTEKLNKLRIDRAFLESELKSGKDNINRLHAEKEDISLRLQKTIDSLPAIQEQIDGYLNQARQIALSDIEKEIIDDLKKQVEELENEKANINKRITAFEEERINNQKKKDELVKQQSMLALELQRIDSELDYLQKHIKEDYNEDYEGSLKYKIEGYNPDCAHQKIAELKRAIKDLGSVNQTAVEEYNELNARHEKMTIEKEDLEKAISDLTTALNEIRSEMQKIFDNGFNLINENFKRTFKELFGGGRAELQLDYANCDDPLNAGVEIVACPSGKSLSKISLLSGGERALTAIAILFAILSMRPMPFCVLDEIEAALDEANVTRYAKYLKKFSQKTQFIVITHRKPTMENCDTLFGVTMEEKGVSKTVSVKLAEVESRLGSDAVS